MTSALVSHLQLLGCREGFDRLANLMPAVTAHLKNVGPEANVDVFNIAGHVTMDAISLSVFNDDLGGSQKLALGVKPDYAVLIDPGDAFAPLTMYAAWQVSHHLKLLTCKL